MPHPVVGGSPYSNAYIVRVEQQAYVYERQIRRRNLLVAMSALSCLCFKTRFLHLGEKIE